MNACIYKVQMIIAYLCMTRLSDESGKMEFSLVEEGTIHRSQLDPNDGVYIATCVACLSCTSKIGSNVCVQWLLFWRENYRKSGNFWCSNIFR